jgi:type VI protein secretion system component VasF
MAYKQKQQRHLYIPPHVRETIDSLAESGFINKHRLFQNDVCEEVDALRSRGIGAYEAFEDVARKNNLSSDTVRTIYYIVSRRYNWIAPDNETIKTLHPDGTILAVPLDLP